jgi:ArsR family transcriptional regulator
MAATQTRTDAEFFAAMFGALSEPVRIEIVGMIAAIDELPCTTLDAVLPIAKSTISYHVRILARAGLIEVRKAGRFYFYRLQRVVFVRHLPGFLESLEQQRLS